MSKRKTNVEFVADLMQFSEQGALIQVFVMEALRHYAETVIADPIPSGGIISTEIWDRCAKEVQAKLKARLA